MANFIYTKAFTALLKADLDFDTLDLRAILVMTNTTADTEEDAQYVGDLTTLDEYDGANYARQPLLSEVINEDLANNRAEFDCADLTFPSLGVGTRQCQAMLIYAHVTNDADSPLVGYFDDGGFPFNGKGTDVDVAINTEGLFQAKNAV